MLADGFGCRTQIHHAGAVIPLYSAEALAAVVAAAAAAGPPILGARRLRRSI